jgi:iron complex transport system ATP-binding protein
VASVQTSKVGGLMSYEIPLQVKNLSFAYDRLDVLHLVEGDFYQGTFYGIAGPNGSGKSTWLKLMAGLNNCPHNRIHIFGQDIHKMPRMTLAKKISFVPQMFNMKYAFTVEEVIMMGRYPYTNRMTNITKKDHDKVESTLLETNLMPLRNRYVNELSGGELQRVVIARAIAQDTDIILLDEPISHLDIHYQFEIIALLKEICRKQNKIVISVLHDLNITMNHCDHIFLMKEGRIIKQGEPLKILTEENIDEVYNLKVNMLINHDKKWITW